MPDHVPYPSGDLHIGHWYAISPPTPARYKRMCVHNVLPMGFDWPRRKMLPSHNIPRK